jgi:hypothetical protein
MSLLPSTSHANPTTPFWGTGSGAVTSIIAGPGISVDTPTGNVTITNTGGGASVETKIGVYPTSGSVPLGIDAPGSAVLGTIEPANFYPTKDNFYTVGVSLVVSSVVFLNPAYRGNLLLGLSYDDGTNTAGVSAQSVYIADDFNISSSSYAFSLTIGFQEQTGYTLKLVLSNETTDKITSLDYLITNFYSVDQGPTGQTGLTIFV